MALIGSVFTVKVAFAADPDSTTWTDISAYVRTVDISRGRQSELEQYNPGTCTVTLDNRDRRFDPFYSSSPYFPFVTPMRHIQILAGGIALFTGYVDSWPQSYDLGGDATVSVSATDAFKVLANLPLQAYRTAVLADSPTVYYRLGETSGSIMFDSSTTGADGTYGSPTTTNHTTTGLVTNSTDAAIAFDGVLDYGTIPTAGLVSAFPFTVECLFSTTTAGSSPLWLQTDGSTRRDIGVWIQSGVISGIAEDFDPGISLQTVASGTWNDGKTHHLMVRFLNGTTGFSIFIDGTDVTGATTNLFASTFPAYAGAGYVGLQKATNSHFHGTLDELAVYPTDLGTSAAGLHYAVLQSYPNVTSGTRVESILSAAGYAGATNIHGVTDGVTLVSTQDVESVNALEALQTVERSEGGYLFVAADGTLTFLARNNLYDGVYPKGTTSQFTLSDTVGATYPYNDLVFAPSDELLRNYIDVTSVAGYVGHAEDSASQAAYLMWKWSPSGDVLTDTTTTQAHADWILNRYKNPLQRVKQLTVPATIGTGLLLTAVEQVDLLWRLTVHRTPQGVGTAISQDALVEGITHSVTVDEWSVTYVLTPAQTLSPLIVDDPTNGIVDTNIVGF